MSATFGRTAVELVRDDITRADVDAIVNAANSSLQGGGGVDGAIHRAAGPELARAGRDAGGCPTGEARILPGFRLPARWVIATVGPVYRGGTSGEPELLAACHHRSIELAQDHYLSSIAFPAISTGVYGYPLDLAAAIALGAVREALTPDSSLTLVRFVLFSDEALQVFNRALDTLMTELPPPPG